MTIVEIIKARTLELTGDFSFIYGSKDVLNLKTDEAVFPVCMLADPIKSKGFRSTGGHIDHTYSLTIILAGKSELDWEFEVQHQPVIAAMRNSCDELIARLEKDTDNIREVAKNFVVTDLINMFDVNMSGVFLEIEIKTVNNNSICV